MRSQSREAAGARSRGGTGLATVWGEQDSGPLPGCQGFAAPARGRPVRKGHGLRPHSLTRPAWFAGSRCPRRLACDHPGRRGVDPQPRRLARNSQIDPRGGVFRAGRRAHDAEIRRAVPRWRERGPGRRVEHPPPFGPFRGRSHRGGPLARASSIRPSTRAGSQSEGVRFHDLHPACRGPSSLRRDQKRPCCPSRRVIGLRCGKASTSSSGASCGRPSSRNRISIAFDTAFPEKWLFVITTVSSC